MARFRRKPLLFPSYFINICLSVRQITSIIRKENIQLIHSNSTNAHIFVELAVT